MVYLATNELQLYDITGIELISIEDAVTALSTLEEINLDTETEGLDFNTKRLLLLQLGNDEHQYLFDIASFKFRIPKLLVDFLNASKSLFVMQNAKFDLKFMMKQDVLITKVYDTMLAEIILTNGLQYSGRDLATLAEKYCGEQLDKSVRGTIIKQGITTAVLFYGARDIEFLTKIKCKQLAQLNHLNLLNAVNLDNSFVVVLAYMEYCGIKLDREKWQTRYNENLNKAMVASIELSEFLWKDGKTECFSGMQDIFTGEHDCIINWNSPKQVIPLFKSYGIKVTAYVKGEEKETIDAKFMAPQADKFAILPLYLAYKEIQKDLSTYGISWFRFINPKTGRIHTTFQQLMDTGRLSSGNKRDGTPNLQNLPSDEATRACFVASPGTVLIDVDYSGQESVVLTNLSKDENLIKFYNQGFADLHCYVAFLIYPEIQTCDPNNITDDALIYIKKNHPDKRQIAKKAEFAIAYGGNGDTIAKNCQLTKAEGARVYDSYFLAFPGLRAYFDLVLAKASRDKYITYNNITNRKFFFNPETTPYFKLKDEVEAEDFWHWPDAKDKYKQYKTSESEVARKAQNYPIQGTAADITKFSGVLFFRVMLEKGWLHTVKLVNMVHDEWLIECPLELEAEVTVEIKRCMEEAAVPFSPYITLTADSVSGDHWVH